MLLLANVKRLQNLKRNIIVIIHISSTQNRLAFFH
jgi:hypothetical protein